MFFRNAVSVLLLLSLAGCASKKAFFVSPQEFSQTMVAQIEARVLRTGDDVELTVEVNGKKEIPTARLELGHGGTIPAPLIGDVLVEGMSIPEARAALENRYSRIFVVSPLITLRMADDAMSGEWGYVTVLGQVRNPGRFPVSSIAGMNLSDALHEAGGFGPNANMRAVVATRQLSDGKLLQCECDVTQLGRAGSGQVDVVLFGGDIVHVPERLF